MLGNEKTDKVVCVTYLDGSISKDIESSEHLKSRMDVVEILFLFKLKKAWMIG